MMILYNVCYAIMIGPSIYINKEREREDNLWCDMVCFGLMSVRIDIQLKKLCYWTYIHFGNTNPDAPLLAIHFPVYLSHKTNYHTNQPEIILRV